MSLRRVGMCYLQETRWKMGSVKQIIGKDSRFKGFRSANEKGTGEVVPLAEKWWEMVCEVVRVLERFILIRITIGKTV